MQTTIAAMAAMTKNVIMYVLIAPRCFSATSEKKNIEPIVLFSGVVVAVVVVVYY